MWSRGIVSSLVEELRRDGSDRTRPAYALQLLVQISRNRALAQRLVTETEYLPLVLSMLGSSLDKVEASQNVAATELSIDGKIHPSSRVEKQKVEIISGALKAISRVRPA